MDLKKILQEKQLEMREALGAYDKFLATLPEKEEDRSEKQAGKLAEMLSAQDELESAIVELEKKIERQAQAERFESRKSRFAEVVDEKPETPVHVEVQDKPVYEGRWALGQQLIDLATVSTHRTRSTPQGKEAARRIERAENRRANIAQRMNSFRAAQTPSHSEIVPSDGGIFLQTETSTEMLDTSVGLGAIASQARRRTMSGPVTKHEVIAVDETSRADGYRYGGIRWYPVAELADITASQTKWNKVALEPKKIGAAYHASEEVLTDVTFLSGDVNDLVTKEYAFSIDHYAYEGDGASDPMLGLMNCPAKIAVPKVAAQTADTIVAQNVMDMKKRCSGYQNAVWFANQFIEDQLIQLFIPLGDAGELMKIYTPPMTPDDVATLWGRPLYFTEHCNELGDDGDLVLADMTQYYIVDKGGISMASSIHVAFLAEQRTFRFTSRVDGQCIWKTPVTAYKGSTTISPIVTIADRA